MPLFNRSTGLEAPALVEAKVWPELSQATQERIVKLTEGLTDEQLAKLTPIEWQDWFMAVKNREGTSLVFPNTGARPPETMADYSHTMTEGEARAEAEKDILQRLEVEVGNSQNAVLIANAMMAQYSCPVCGQPKDMGQGLCRSCQSLLNSLAAEKHGATVLEDNRTVRAHLLDRVAGNEG